MSPHDQAFLRSIKVWCGIGAALFLCSLATLGICLYVAAKAEKAIDENCRSVIQRGTSDGKSGAELKTALV